MKVSDADNPDLQSYISLSSFENIDVVDISGATATVVMPLVAASKLSADSFSSGTSGVQVVDTPIDGICI